jgi:flagellar motility protein MotE (MotC chaperone)
MIAFAIGFLRELRLVPIVLIATGALFALKALGLVLDNDYLFDGTAGSDADKAKIIAVAAPPGNAASPAAGARPDTAGIVGRSSPQPAPKSWAQDMFNFPDVTGAVGEPPAPANAQASPPKSEPAPKKPLEPPKSSNGTPVQLESDRAVSPAERAILESLQKRRTELDARSRELDMREDLLRAAEKRLEGRLAELKELETRVDQSLQKKTEGDAARFKNVVTMYESMKAKDAAKIFDGLDIKVLLDVAKAINPRQMSEILAQMSPDTAQRLTTELAMRSSPSDQPQPADLPKIQGKPSSN